MGSILMEEEVLPTGGAMGPQYPYQDYTAKVHLWLEKTFQAQSNDWEHLRVDLTSCLMGWTLVSDSLRVNFRLSIPLV